MDFFVVLDSTIRPENWPLFKGFTGISRKIYPIKFNDLLNFAIGSGINMKNKEDLEGYFVDSHKSPKKIFTYIYENNVWRDPESVSGRGSSLAATTQLRQQIIEFFKKYDIRSLIDTPCGDFNWFQALNYQFEKYVGYDIVQELIEKNEKRYGSHHIHFRCANILEDMLETADIALCRDFLIHSSNKNIFAFFENLRKNKINGVLISHYKNCKNIDIPTGNRYRPIDFTLPPFCFPEPEYLIHENINHMKDTANHFAVNKSKPLEKYLSFWRVKDLP